MKWAPYTAKDRRSLLGRFLLVSLPIWLLMSGACAPGRLSGGPIGDPCFSGTYEFADATRSLSATVVHRRGALTLSGFNSQPDATIPWELLSISGNTETTGQAAGNVMVWFPRSAGLPVMGEGLGEARLTLPGDRDCTTRTALTLSFSYSDTRGRRFDEVHTLTRR